MLRVPETGVVSVSSAAARRDDRDGPDRRAHLTRDGSKVDAHTLLNSESEAYCIDCGCRVTVGKSGTEYGHARYPRTNRPGKTRCPHRPASVDPDRDPTASERSQR